MWVPQHSTTSSGSGFGISKSAKRRSELVAAVVYLAAALILAAYLRFLFFWDRSAWLRDCCLVASLLGVFLLVVSSVRVFRQLSFGDVSALAGAVFVIPFLTISYSYRYSFSPWLAFNLPLPLSRGLLLVILTISAIVAVIAATAYSVPRLTPDRWRVRNVSLRNRVWPGFVITIVLVFGWYFKSVVPYQIPIAARGVRPELSVLHVEKHGLQFHETKIAFYRDAAFYLSQDDHRLFQYRFETRKASGVLSRDRFQSMNRLVASPPAFGGHPVPYFLPPRAWDADRWFVVCGARTRPVAIRVEGSTMPMEVVELFNAALKMPQNRAWQETAWDVCLGFCYYPLD